MGLVKPLLKLVYTDEASKPLLVLSALRGAEFHHLQELFRQLSQTDGGVFDLHRQSFIAAPTNTSVALVCTGPMFARPWEGRYGLRRTGGVAAHNFEWRRTAEGWDYLAELIDSMLQSEAGGYQQLTFCPEDDAVFELRIDAS